MRLIEIRSYQLKPGSADEFHALVSQQAVPMLHRWKTDVVAFGPSAHEPETYFLARSYSSLVDLETQQDAFYGSVEWREGPRQAILSLIESHLSTVLWLSEPSIDDLRRCNPSVGPDGNRPSSAQA